MAEYTWYRDAKSGICTKVECATPASAASLQKHLRNEGIPCTLHGTRIEFESKPDFLAVIRASEPFIGICLISRAHRNEEHE